MIAYHAMRVEEAARAVTEGLRRSGGRHFVFERWDDVQTLLREITAEAAPEQYAVLVINADPDMLLPAPVPLRTPPAQIALEELEDLQQRSAYLEMDLSPQRVLDVRDALGNSIRNRYANTPRRRNALRRFLSHARPYAPWIAGATAFGILKFTAPMVFPWALRVMLDEVVLGKGIAAADQLQRVHQLIAVMAGALVLWMVASYYRSVLAAVAGHRMIRDLRVALFAHVQRLSHSFFARNRSGAIVSRVVNDLSLAQNFVGSALTNVWMDGTLLVILVAVLWSIHPKLTLVSMALMPLYVFSIRIVGKRVRLISREAQQRLELLSGNLQERIAGVSIVKGFTREQLETRAFALQANKLLAKIVHSVRSTAMNEVLVGAVVHGSPVLVAWYGVHQILVGRLSVGELTQFLLYLAMFYFPLQRLSELTVVLANSLAAIDRIFEYFDTQPAVNERRDAVNFERCEGRIEFDHVQFGYDPGRPVLHDICLEIEPGQTVAIVGPSGSGKSTLANLVPRFYDPVAGSVRIDGRDLRDVSLASLRRHIGIVNQETVLFSGTVEDNLLLANPQASAAEVRLALEAANASEFVDRLPDGWWTEIGERGAVLSGGQKQRLAIARAFLKNPRILILDEATSALDSRTEHLIQEALARLLRQRTSIVIAHRFSTIVNADRIVVMDSGRIVESGDHGSLLRRGGLYAQLYAEQFRHLEPVAV